MSEISFSSNLTGDRRVELSPQPFAHQCCGNCQHYWVVRPDGYLDACERPAQPLAFSGGVGCPSYVCASDEHIAANLFALHRLIGWAVEK